MKLLISNALFRKRHHHHAFEGIFRRISDVINTRQKSASRVTKQLHETFEQLLRNVIFSY